MKNVLITGGAGFIAHHLIYYLIHNTDWNFNSEVTIGQGMFSKRNVWMSNKVIEVKPQPDEDTVDSDELF